MNMYQQKSRWKFYLAILGVGIILFSLFYTNNLTKALAEEERKKVDIWLFAQEEINDFDEEDLDYVDVTLHNKILSGNTTIPIILEGEMGEIIFAANYGKDLTPDNERFFQDEVRALQKEGFEPIQGFASAIYYKESSLLRQLRYYPYIQFLLIGTFVFFGYLALNNVRRSEQNRVWAGMAKETAHQLGTPISAIMAWVEHLKFIGEEDEEILEVASELEKDVNRLDLVADRFSKIGSDPTMEIVNIYGQLDSVRVYMQKRAPRKMVFDFPDKDQGDINVNINPHLFDWVIENLLRNALDSMGGQGKITALVHADDKFVNIDISDTGKGIPQNKFKTVFSPGYSTKKRGWGLGLSLAKRIIEGSHKGKIFVKKSVINEGTTFSIKLPRA